MNSKKALKFKRRQLLQGAFISIVMSLFYFIKKLWGRQDNIDQEMMMTSKNKLSILQGATSSTQTQISICYPQTQEITVFATTLNGPQITPSDLIYKSFPNTTHHFLTVIFTDLSIDETYTLIVQNKSSIELDRRTFKMLDTQKMEAACALISCAHDRNKEIQSEMWKAVESSKPDALFLLGDNVYVDWHEALPASGVIDEAHIWNRYTHIRNLFYLYQMPKLIPTFAIWDDHDTGTNNGYKDSPLISEVTKIFDIAFPRNNMDSVLKRTYGIGYHLKLFGLEIMMMDNRTFRTDKSDLIHSTHWGDKQEAWVAETLRDAKSPVWIMNGSQFFGGYRGGETESFELVHNLKFKDWFLAVLKSASNPVLLTSGDIHYSEIQRIEPEVVGYPLYEITSSSIHSTKKYLESKEDVKPKHVIEPNTGERRLAVTGEFNFILANIKTNPKSIDVTTTSLGIDSKKYFEVNFSVSKNT